MADFNTKSIRNIVLLGHGGSGKTSIAEAALYLAKHTDRMVSGSIMWPMRRWMLIMRTVSM